MSKTLVSYVPLGGLTGDFRLDHIARHLLESLHHKAHVRGLVVRDVSVERDSWLPEHIVRARCDALPPSEGWDADGAPTVVYPEGA